MHEKYSVHNVTYDTRTLACVQTYAYLCMQLESGQQAPQPRIGSARGRLVSRLSPCLHVSLWFGLSRDKKAQKARRLA